MPINETLLIKLKWSYLNLEHAKTTLDWLQQGYLWSADLKGTLWDMFDRASISYNVDRNILYTSSVLIQIMGPQEMKRPTQHARRPIYLDHREPKSFYSKRHEWTFEQRPIMWMPFLRSATLKSFQKMTIDGKKVVIFWQSVVFSALWGTNQLGNKAGIGKSFLEFRVLGIGTIRQWTRICRFNNRVV